MIIKLFISFLFITLTLLYLYLLHVFPPLLSFFSFTGCRMVSVFWTLWFCYSISKSLSWSWGLSPVTFRQLASQPTPSHRGQVQCTIWSDRGAIILPYDLPLTYVMSSWALCICHVFGLQMITETRLTSMVTHFMLTVCVDNFCPID